MSRKRKDAVPQPAQTPARGMPAPPRIAPPSPPRAARPATNGPVRRSNMPWLIGGGVLIVLAIAGLIGWRLMANTASATAETPRPAYKVGGVTSCRPQPAFTTKLGYTPRAVFSSRERTETGLILYEPDAQGNITKRFQDPTWTTAGFVLPPVTDRDGNVYVAPAPSINVLYNPIARSNTLFRIDTQNGKMAPYLELPPATTPSPDNPYGIMGMAYDCDSNSLYASSVFGSDREKVAGRIFRVDLATGKVAARLDDVDAFGVTIYNTAHGKRLLYGLARTAMVRSVALDNAGNFTSDVRDEVSLAGMGEHGDERARRLQVDPQNNLIVRTMQFSFNLVAPTETRQTAFQYRYDAAKDTWQLTGSTPIQ